jgi:hypothetical protein
MKEFAEFGLLVAWLGILFVATLLIVRRWYGDGARSTAVATGFVLSFVFGSIFHPTTLFSAANSVIEQALHSMVATLGSALSGTNRSGPVTCPAGTPVSTDIGRGSLDSVGVVRGDAVQEVKDGASVAVTDTLVFSGWLVDDLGTTFAVAPCAIVDGSVFGNAREVYHLVRPDVGAALNNQALAASGFEVRIDASAIHIGKHQFDIGALAQNRQTSSRLPRVITLIIVKS